MDRLNSAGAVTCSAVVTPLAATAARMGSADCEDIVGTIVLARVEDWLSEWPKEGMTKQCAADYENTSDEFLNQVSVLIGSAVADKIRTNLKDQINTHVI